jgi:hypothetical protein
MIIAIRVKKNSVGTDKIFLKNKEDVYEKAIGSKGTAQILQQHSSG